MKYCTQCYESNVEFKEHLTFNYWYCKSCKDEVEVSNVAPASSMYGVDYALGADGIGAKPGLKIKSRLAEAYENSTDPRKPYQNNSPNFQKQADNAAKNCPAIGKAKFPMTNLPNQVTNQSDVTDFIIGFFGKENLGTCFVSMGGGF